MPTILETQQYEEPNQNTFIDFDIEKSYTQNTHLSDEEIDAYCKMDISDTINNTKNLILHWSSKIFLYSCIPLGIILFFYLVFMFTTQPSTHWLLLLLLPISPFIPLLISVPVVDMIEYIRKNSKHYSKKLKKINFQFKDLHTDNKLKYMFYCYLKCNKKTELSGKLVSITQQEYLKKIEYIKNFLDNLESGKLTIEDLQFLIHQDETIREEYKSIVKNNQNYISIKDKEKLMQNINGIEHHLYKDKNSFSNNSDQEDFNFKKQK